MGAPILRYFAYDHLREGPLRDTSARFHTLAHELDKALPPSAEASTALRKLLEANAAVRAALYLERRGPPRPPWERGAFRRSASRTVR